MNGLVRHYEVELGFQAVGRHLYSREWMGDDGNWEKVEVDAEGNRAAVRSSSGNGTGGVDDWVGRVLQEIKDDAERRKVGG